MGDSPTSHLSKPSDPTQGDGRRSAPVARGIIASTVVGLVLALVFEALALAGIVSMNAAHLALIAAWLVVVVGVCTSEKIAAKPRKHIIVVGILAMVGTGILALALDRWMVWRRAQQDQKPSEAYATASPNPMSLSIATQSPSALRSPSPILHLGSDNTGNKNKSSEQKNQDRNAGRQQTVSDNKPTWTEITGWVRSLYPEGTRMNIEPADDSQCGAGCQKYKVVLRASGDQTRNESVTVTYHFANGRWNWKAIKN